MKNSISSFFILRKCVNNCVLRTCPQKKSRRVYSLPPVLPRIQTQSSSFSNFSVCMYDVYVEGVQMTVGMIQLMIKSRYIIASTAS